MKKNTKTYILLVVVLCIWGAIGYQIVRSLSSNPGERNTIKIASFEPKTVTKRTTFTIDANYRDPFLGILTSQKKKTKVETNIQASQALSEVVIRYTGFITEKATKKKIFFITVDGQQQLLFINDKIGDLILLSGSESNVKIKYKNNIKIIALQE